MLACKNEDYDQTQTGTDPMDPSVTTTSTTDGWGYEKGDDKFHAGIVNLTLDINSTWKVTGDSYVASLTVVGMKGVTADSEVMVFFNKRSVSVKAK